jgi:uncharacterized damage-inducible protein DinB
MVVAMSDADLADQIVDAWRVNDRITLRMLAALAPKDLLAVPTGSRGRNVSQVFAHLHKARATPRR